MRRNVFQEKKEAFIKKAEEKWDRKCQNKIFLLANEMEQNLRLLFLQFCCVQNMSGAGALHLPRSNCVSWSCVARNLPAGAVQPAQWRELEVSSSRAPAESPAVMRCPVGSRTFVPRWNRRRGKDHEGCAPSNSAAGESHLHLGNQVCRLYKNSMVQVRCICRSPAAQAGRRRRNLPRRSGPIRSMART